MSGMVRRRQTSPSAAVYDEKNEKVLRIAASDVAAVAGYHQWTDVRDLFLERLLYQGLEHVLHQDAENLGLEVEDRRQRFERLLAKSGDGEKELRTVRKRAESGDAVATVIDAQTLRQKAQSLVAQAAKHRKLTAEEARELENDLRHDINTQFGTRNEAFALRVYERRTGTEVLCSNDRILVWPFPGDRNGDGVPEDAMDPPAELSKGWTKPRTRNLKRARRSPSAVPDVAFAAAIARCLAEVPVRALLQNVVERVLLDAERGEVVQGDRQSRKEGRGSSVEHGSSGGAGLESGQHVTHAIDYGGRCASRSRVRQLRPGIAWPEWRTAAWARHTREGDAKAMAPSAARNYLQSEAGGNEWGGEPALWFPPTLTSTQRDVLADVARDMNLCHDYVHVSAGDSRMVVWELSSRGLGSAVPSTEQVQSVRKASVFLPSPDKTENVGKTRAASNRAEERPDTRIDRGPIAAGNDAGRRSSYRVVMQSEQVEAGGTPKVVADVVADVVAASATSAAVSEARVSSGPEANGSKSDQGSGHGKEALDLPEACVGQDPDDAATVISRAEDALAVFAWGEGPCAAAESNTEQSPAEIQEPSVWSRVQQLSSPEAEKIVAELPLPSLQPREDGTTEREYAAKVGAAGEGSDAASFTLGSAITNTDKKREMRGRPCFVIAGAVDGVAEEVINAREDADTWDTRTVVVEVKNRMNRAMHPPPLYDQIQLVTYMLMTGSTAGDLVQLVKKCNGHGRGSRRARTDGEDIEQVDKAGALEDEVKVSRVELDCRIYHHGRHWKDVILPRLYAFARMVYRFRVDDLLRWRYLLAGPAEQRDMLVECCPYLSDVIPKPTAPAPPLSHQSSSGQRDVECLAADKEQSFSAGAFSASLVDIADPSEVPGTNTPANTPTDGTRSGHAVDDACAQASSDCSTSRGSNERGAFSGPNQGVRLRDVSETADSLPNLLSDESVGGIRHPLKKVKFDNGCAMDGVRVG